MKDIEKVFITLNATIEEAVAKIQEGGIGITLIVDKEQRLLSTITDGDIRRAILQKIQLDEKVSRILENRSPDYPQPVVLPAGAPHEEILSLMEAKDLRHIPLLDDVKRVVEVSLLSELIEEEHHLPVTAVVMAGGKGTRLLPLTRDIPKPMLPLDKSPIVERIIRQLCLDGIDDIYISINYKSEIIQNHFGNGDVIGASIKYIHEESPLGTAGALGLMEKPKQPVMVINGDILTQLNFRVMYDFHRSHQADMTVAVRIYEIEIPYGVIETEDIHIKKLVEKPQQACIVSAGIYLLDPSVYQYIPKGKRFDMTDLVECLLMEKRKVISFPIQEYWLDVGQHRDYAQARNDVKSGRL